MYEIEIPSGVKVEINGEVFMIKGKLGSTTKKIRSKFAHITLSGSKLTIEEVKNKKLAKKSVLAAQSINTELTTAISGVEKGVEVKMKVLYAHFPATIEIKGKKLFLKNLFGEKVPREISIVGDTKVEVKGQDVTVKGVDNYDVGQTIANIRKGCYARGYDTRVFQDGLYVVTEE